MPSAYYIFPSDDLLLVRYWGTLTPRCVLGLIDELSDDPGFRDGMNELDDLRGVTEFALSEAELGQMAALVAGLNLVSEMPRKKALLVTDQTTIHPARSYAKLLRAQSNIDVQVFMQLDEATRFLGVDGSPVARQISDPNALT
ncbi:MAG: hypothetical protein ACWA47_04645 [Brevirhabdus sp.]